MVSSALKNVVSTPVMGRLHKLLGCRGGFLHPLALCRRMQGLHCKCPLKRLICGYGECLVLIGSEREREREGDRDIGCVGFVAMATSPSLRSISWMLSTR